MSRARDAVDVVNFDTMKLVATLPAETSPHTLNIDPLTHHLYVSEDDGNVVDVWHYTNAGHDRMTFTDGGQQVTASVGAVARVPAACRTCCNPRVPAACQPMGAAAGSAGAGGRRDATGGHDIRIGLAGDTGPRQRSQCDHGYFRPRRIARSRRIGRA
ncbi:MAG TPA: hypothetical protein VK822_14760 [Acetobacteraceae bacterium]|nr:hypothetical protein [Acetobacteraceae bacterium]